MHVNFSPVCQPHRKLYMNVAWDCYDVDSTLTPSVQFYQPPHKAFNFGLYCSDLNHSSCKILNIYIF